MTPEQECTWNHRIVRTTEDGEVIYQFAEAHYLDGKLIAYSNPFMMSETLEGLQELHDQLGRALTHPVIDGDTLESITPSEG